MKQSYLTGQVTGENHPLPYKLCDDNWNIFPLHSLSLGGLSLIAIYYRELFTSYITYPDVQIAKPFVQRKNNVLSTLIKIILTIM